MKIHLLSVIIGLLFVSCSSVSFFSSATMPTSLGLKDRHGTPVEIILSREFYLWGLLPTEQKVEIDRELAQLGILGAANISIKKYQTLAQSFWTISTFGLYHPVTIQIRALAQTVEEKKYSPGRWR